MEKVNWPMVGVRAVSTIVIIVITLLIFASQTTQVLREEMRAEFTEIRTDFNELRSEFSALCPFQAEICTRFLTSRV